MNIVLTLLAPTELGSSFSCQRRCGQIGVNRKINSDLIDMFRRRNRKNKHRLSVVPLVGQQSTKFSALHERLMSIACAMCNCACHVLVGTHATECLQFNDTVPYMISFAYSFNITDVKKTLNPRIKKRIRNVKNVE